MRYDMCIAHLTAKAIHGHSTREEERRRKKKKKKKKKEEDTHDSCRTNSTPLRALLRSRQQQDRGLYIPPSSFPQLLVVERTIAGVFDRPYVF